MTLFQQVSGKLFYIAVVLSLFSCEPQQPGQINSQLQVATNLWLGYEPLFMARHLNYWDDDQIRLIEYSSSIESLRAFRNGSIDAATLTMDEALSLHKDNIPFHIILVHDISDGGDVIMAKPGIQSIQDLKGKNIAVEISALGAVVTTRALSIHGLTTDDVNIISSHVTGHLDLYESDQIDAAVTYEPLRTALLHAGAEEIFSSREIPGEIVDVLVARKAYVEAHPEQIQILVDGWFRALEHLEKQPDESYNIISQRLQVSAADVEEMFRGIIIPSKSENARLLGSSDQQLANAAKSLNQVMIDNQLISGMVDFEDIPIDTFVISHPSAEQGSAQ